jgi:invasion protein IalB
MASENCLETTAGHPGDMNMKRSIIVGGALVAVLFPGVGLAQGALKSRHGQWEMRCDASAVARRQQCALVQSIAAVDRPKVTLVVTALKTDEGKARLLRVIAPLGLLIPAGLGLKVDQIEVGRAGFVRCLDTGCVAEVAMEDKLIEQLGAGKQATFTVFATPNDGIGVPLTLAGFKDGFAKLP